MKNSDLEQRYKEIVEDNVNVGKTNDGTEFLILITGIIAIFFVIYLFADSISNLVIDRLPDKTITQIERTIQSKSKFKNSKNPETEAQLEKLETLKQRIIAQDKNLQNKPSFPISIEPMKKVNAFIEIDGSIHFTEGLLKKINDDEILTFVLAHELGHYVHRDCLKHASRQIIVGLITSVFSNNQNNVGAAITGISEMNALTYSRAQEKRADEYANQMLFKIYGRNTAAIEFFKYLEKEEKDPEFMQYFSTHPSTQQRLKFAKNMRP